MDKFCLSPDFIRFETSCKDWEQAIKMSSEPLLRNGYINKEYQQAMIDSVVEYGPYIVIAPHIAMPHARPETGSQKVGYSLMRLEKAVAFSEEEMHQVKLLIALSCKDSDTHLEILQNLVMVLSDEKRLDIIMNSQDKNEISSIFKEAFSNEQSQ